MPTSPIIERWEKGSGETHSEVLGCRWNSQIDAAQGFKLSGTYVVTDVAILILNVVGSPTGSIHIRIESDAGAVPSGSLAFSGAEGNIAIGTGWRALAFSSPGTLQGNTQYWLRAYLDNQSNDNYIFWRLNNGNPYPDGYECQRVNRGSWKPKLDHDLCFRIYGYPGEVPPPPLPPPPPSELARTFWIFIVPVWSGSELDRQMERIAKAGIQYVQSNKLIGVSPNNRKNFFQAAGRFGLKVSPYIMDRAAWNSRTLTDGELAVLREMYNYGNVGAWFAFEEPTFYYSCARWHESPVCPEGSKLDPKDAWTMERWAARYDQLKEEFPDVPVVGAEGPRATAALVVPPNKIDILFCEFYPFGSGENTLQEGRERGRTLMSTLNHNLIAEIEGYGHPVIPLLGSSKHAIELNLRGFTRIMWEVWQEWYPEEIGVAYYSDIMLWAGNEWVLEEVKALNYELGATPPEEFITQEITCSTCESVLEVTISSIPENNRDLLCPICEIPIRTGVKVVAISTPLVDKLEEDIRALDTTKIELEEAIVSKIAQIDVLKAELGL